MARKDDLVKQFGDRMDASMGAVRPAAEQGGAPLVAGRYDGTRALRDARLIPLALLVPDPDQPRKVFDAGELQQLADSIAAEGVLQPVRARWDEGLGKWVLIAGERRYRAARLAGLKEIPCITVEGAVDPARILVAQLVENCLRADLRPLEQAAAFRALMDARGWSARQVAAELHLAPNTVLRALDLLDLPAGVRDRVAAGELAPATAAEIARLDRPDDQVELADRAVAEGLSRDAVGGEVRERVGRPGKAGRYRASHEHQGVTVTVTGPAGVTPEAVLAALQAALKALRVRSKGRAA